MVVPLQELRQFGAKEKKSQLSAVYFHSEAKGYTPGFLAAASRFQGAVRFGSMRADHLKASYREEYGLDRDGKGLPLLRVWGGPRLHPERHDGSMTDDAVSRFLTSAAEKCSPERQAEQAQRRPGATEVHELEVRRVREPELGTLIRLAFPWHPGPFGKRGVPRSDRLPGETGRRVPTGKYPCTGDED